MLKAQIDLEFLVSCSSNSVVPKFLIFQEVTKSLKSSRKYQQCQLSLLQDEIRQKKPNIKVLLKESEFLHSTLQAKINFVDFAHVRSLFLGHNDKVLKQKVRSNKRNSITYSMRNRSMISSKLFLIILAMFHQKLLKLYVDLIFPQTVVKIF